MLWYSSEVLAASRTARLARATATTETSRSRSGLVSWDRRFSISAEKVSTAIRLASCPPAAPPIPSQTTQIVCPKAVFTAYAS